MKPQKLYQNDILLLWNSSEWLVKLSDYMFINVYIRTKVSKIAKKVTGHSFDGTAYCRDCVKRIMNNTSSTVTENNIASAWKFCGGLSLSKCSPASYRLTRKRRYLRLTFDGGIVHRSLMLSDLFMRESKIISKFDPSLFYFSFLFFCLLYFVSFVLIDLIDYITIIIPSIYR